MDDNLVVGCVGRITYQKNPEMTISIFREIKLLYPNSILVMVGDGDLMSAVKDRVRELDLINDVLFLGNRTDVDSLMNAFDIFVLPSRYEGLGIVFIEAQANGLHCIASSEGVPREVNICKNVTFVSLMEPPENWAKIIVRNSKRNNNTREIMCQVENAGYNINQEVHKLEKLYMGE